MFQSQVRGGKTEESSGGGRQHWKDGKGAGRIVEGISLRERGWGESGEGELRVNVEGG